jgi:hypothetical protein
MAARCAQLPPRRAAGPDQCFGEVVGDERSCGHAIERFHRGIRVGGQLEAERTSPSVSAPATRKRKTEATRPIATRRSLNQRRLSNRKARNVGFSRFRQRTAPPPVNPHTSPITSKLVRILKMFDLNSRGTAGRARPSACASRSSSTSQSPPTPPPGSTPLFGLVLQLCGRALPVVPFHLQAPAHRYRLWRIA